MEAIVSMLLLAAALVPTKNWFTPEQPVTVEVRDVGGAANLVLTNFTGNRLDPKGSAEVADGKTVNLNDLFPQLGTPGTYILYLTKQGGEAARAADLTKDFVGTPLVIEVRENRKRGAPPGTMVIKVEPLRYAVMQTDKGPVTLAFYYDVAPNTVDSFLELAAGGYFDGMLFHRVVKDFVIQGGDPLGYDPARAGTGGPGFQIDAEFNDRLHEAGALSMARSGDPGEKSGLAPRPDFANSAGSQFFVSLDYNDSTKSLDRKYTVFGKVTSGMDAVKQIGAVAVDAKDRPTTPQPIKKIEVKPVAPGENPYVGLLAPKQDAADAAAPTGSKEQPAK